MRRARRPRGRRTTAGPERHRARSRRLSALRHGPSERRCLQPARQRLQPSSQDDHCGALFASLTIRRQRVDWTCEVVDPSEPEDLRGFARTCTTRRPAPHEHAFALRPAGGGGRRYGQRSTPSPPAFGRLHACDAPPSQSLHGVPTCRPSPRMTGPRSSTRTGAADSRSSSITAGRSRADDWDNQMMFFLGEGYPGDRP